MEREPETLRQKLKRWLHLFSRDIVALYLAARDRRTPTHIRLFVILWVALAVSPIDLIPDFIPILRDVGDLVFLPLGYVIAIRWVPRDVLSECRTRAEGHLGTWLKVELALGLAVALFWVVYSVWRLGFA